MTHHPHHPDADPAPGATDTDPSPYLWDFSGTPDPLTLRLERALRPRSFSARRRRSESRSTLIALAAAAALMLSAAVVIVLLSRPPGPALAGSTWRIASLPAGATLAPPRTIKATFAAFDLSVAPSKSAGDAAAIESGRATRLTASSGVELTLIDGDPGHPWLELRAGRIEIAVGPGDRPLGVEVAGGNATIAPDSRAVVVAERDGAARVEVAAGRADVTHAQRRLRLAGGSGTRLVPGEPPELPLASGAQKELADAAHTLWHIPRTNADQKLVEWSLERLLRTARAADAPALWNLLAVLPEPQRQPLARWLLDAAPAEAALPPLDALLRAEPEALDMLWRGLTTPPAR